MAAVAYQPTIQPRRQQERVLQSSWSPQIVRLQPRTSAATFRRRRLLAAMLATSVLLVAGMVLGRLGAGPLASSEKVSPLIAHQTYVVQSGDTDWGIARKVQPNGDIRPLVDQIAKEHAGRALQIGDSITIP